MKDTEKNAPESGDRITKIRSETALAVVCGCLTPVFASQPEPAAAKDTAGAAAMDGGIALPVADGSVAVEDGGTVTQPTVTTRTDADGNFILRVCFVG